MAGDGFEYQASPDVEVVLRIMRGADVLDEMEANINISRTVLELKTSLSKPLNLQVAFMEIYKGTLHLNDDNITLLDYSINTDDVLIIRDVSP